MNKIFNKAVNIIFILFPLLIASGPFIADLGVIIIGSYFIITTIINKDFEFYSSKIFQIILIFWIYCIILSFFSANIYLSLESSLFYGRFIFFAMGIGLIIKLNKKILNYFYLVLLLTILIVSIDALFQSLYGFNLLGMEKSHKQRLSGIFQEELVLGSYLTRLFPLFFLILPIFSKNYQYLEGAFRILMIGIVGLVVYNTGERAAFFYFFITLILVFILISKYRRSLIFSFIILVITFTAISFYNPSLKHRMFMVTYKNFEAGFEEHNRIFMFSEQHEAHYLVAMSMFEEKKIFGYGPKLFREICKKYDQFGCSTHPHNTYMQLLSETGIIGFIIFISFFFHICYIFLLQVLKKLSKKKIVYDSNKIVILVSLFISLFPLIPTGSFFNNWLNCIYYLPLGLLFYINHKKIT